MLAPGFQPITGYRLIGQLGEGAFGEVWKAEKADGTFSALKFLNCRTKPTAQIAHEIRIYRALADLHHPYLIPLYGVHASKHYLALEMELADGNLHELHRAYRGEYQRDIPPDHLLELLDQVAAGLDFLANVKLPGFHLISQGVQHCDIKPRNILLVGEVAKIADFGLAACTARQTHHRGWKGTLPYAAPELFHGQTSSTTDQYSLAVTYCELVAGRRLLRATQKGPDAPYEPPVDLTRVREREVTVLNRALHPQPSSRYASCREFITALKKAVHAPRSPKVIRRLPGTSSSLNPLRTRGERDRAGSELAERLRQVLSEETPD
jgi:serine/threonine protein kinase